jgi:small-conductance mechanosensitive channel
MRGQNDSVEAVRPARRGSISPKIAAADMASGGSILDGVLPGTEKKQQVQEINVVMPVLTTRDNDDLAVQLPPNASKWRRFTADPVTRRVSRVLLTLVIGGLVLLVVNLAMVPRSVKCLTPEDCRRVRRLNTVLEGIRPLVNMLIVVILLFIILGECGVNLTALFATAGLLGVIIGVGAQASIKSFIAGIGFVVQDQFSIGDFVAFDFAPGPTRVFGVVTNFRTQVTTVQSFDGASHYVSNGTIAVVTNFSKHAQRAQVDIHVPVSCPIPVDALLKEIEMVTRAMATAPQLRHKMVLPPVLKGMTANADGKFTVTVAAIAHPRAQYAVEWYMRHQLMKLMQRLHVTGTSYALEHGPEDDAGAHAVHVQRDGEQSCADDDALPELEGLLLPDGTFDSVDVPGHMPTIAGPHDVGDGQTRASADGMGSIGGGELNTLLRV